MKRARIAIVVHGRFFAFDLARALIRRGHEVVLFTNYPTWVVRRFGLAPSCARTFPLHGVLTKAVGFIDPESRLSFDGAIHPMFGNWARQRLLREGPWDCIVSFSGVSEEILREPALARVCHLVRASAHIRAQAEILGAEQVRAGRHLDHPSPWIMEREVREYELARSIIVLSKFACDTFTEAGVPAEKLRLLPLGADLDEFRAARPVVDERLRRIRSGAPLTVVYAGNIMYRKGMWDMAEVIRSLAGPRFHFRLVGRVLPEARALVEGLAGRAEFIPKVPQNQLPTFYARGDIFLFPTIEDGSPVVLSQAQASGLPLLATPHCSAPELVERGGGWIVPIRRADLLVERLVWCDEHREELAGIVEAAYNSFRPRDYDQVAEDFERLCLAPATPAAATRERPLKVAVVVQGRFHSFDLARALIARGLDVTVFTSYPYWVAMRWGIPRQRLKTFPAHGVLSRLTGRVREWTYWSPDSLLHTAFGRWAVRQLRDKSHGRPWDVIYAFSGVSEEISREPALAGALRIMVRGSAHIRTQQEILLREQERAGVRLDLPSAWMVAREEKEYQLAERIVVLSQFAFDSFRECGIPAAKLRILPLGTETKAFRPVEQVIEERRRRILSGEPLRVLYVGNFAYRKGITDYAEIVRASGGRFRFRIVGTVTGEARTLAGALSGAVEFVDRRPQSELYKEYNRADIFVFPTLEDGYAVVLSQASAAALPIITTSHCCGPELVQEGLTGWVLPIRCPDAFRERLDWCDSHRPELAAMVTAAWLEFRTRDWSDVAADFESLCRKEIAAKTGDSTYAPVPGVGEEVTS